MKPEVLKMINRAALFADENEDFRIPSEPDADQQVTLRFRTARGDVDSVYYVENGQKTEKPLWKVSSDQQFDYYERRILVDTVPVGYYFHVVKGRDFCYYNRLGAVDMVQDCFNFRITPGFHVPNWAKGSGDLSDFSWTGSAMEIRLMMWRQTSISISGSGDKDHQLGSESVSHGCALFLWR